LLGFERGPGSAESPRSGGDPLSKAAEDAVSGLCNLGKSTNESELAVRMAMAALGPDAGTGQLLRFALKSFAVAA